MHTARDEVHGNAARSRAAGAEWVLLLVLAAMQFTHIMDFVIMMPLGPSFIERFHITTQQFGFLVAAYGLSASVAGLLASFAIDRFDRKHALLVLYGGFAVGTFLCAVAPDFPTLLAARAVAGAFGGLVAATTLAIVGDAFPEERRGLAMGVLMSGFSVATIAGVPAGLHLAEAAGTGAPFAVLAGLSAALLVLGAVVLPPLRGHLAQRNSPFAASTWAVLTHPTHLLAYTLTAGLVLSTFVIIPYIATYLVFNVGWRNLDLQYTYICGGAVTLLTTALFGRLADRFGKLRVFRVLALATMLPVVLLTTLPRGPVAAGLVVTTLFMVLSSGRMVPAMALITSSAAPAYRGSFMSINGSVQQLAAGLASLLGAFLLRQQEANGPLEGFPLAGVLACVMIAATLILAGYLRPAGEPVPAEAPVEAEALAVAAETGITPAIDAVRGAP